MGNCTSCGASLPPDSPVCAYCRTRNDVDLKGVHEYTVTTPASVRICPRCHQPLQTVDLGLKGRFLVERCRLCFGLFLDPNELEALLDISLTHADTIDLARLDALQDLKGRDEYAVAYIACPVCAGMMNRVNWGMRSGVVVDRCRRHGVWLDGGELRRLLQWAKAGGPIHDERLRAEQERHEARAERDRLRAAALARSGDPSSLASGGELDGGERDSILRLLFRFFDPFF